MTRVGADVGGTFTDVVVSGDDGRMTFTKVLSTPPAYDRAVVDAVQSLGGADMQSSGGVMSAADAAERPVYALESGPAAGVVAARALAEALGHPSAIAFDMGGTTAKASLIENGRVSRSQEYEVGASLSAGSRLLRGSGELIRIPTIDIAEVGAGGGSIAWLDHAGALNVGPRSAGARPGPACYGLGGEDPTVTDANVALGFIPEGRIADGGIEISRARAEDALARIAAPARGVHDLANATMMRALRAVSTEKGRDPGDFVLIAYGGSGPVHAAALAAELGVRAAIVPPLAGLFSAIGLLHARAEWHDVRFCRIDGREPDLDELRRLDAEMRRDADDWQRVADVRYRGQSWSVPIDFPGEIDGASVAGLVDRFEAEYETLYGTRLGPGSRVDIRALRLVWLGPERAPLLPSDNLSQGRKEIGSRLADFGEGPVEAPVR